MKTMAYSLNHPPPSIFRQPPPPPPSQINIAAAAAAAVIRLTVQSLPYTRIQASRRPSNFPQDEKYAGDARSWSKSRNGMAIGDYFEDDEEEEDEEEEDRSLDLLVRFVENLFRKVSKRARKAVRSVLPQNFSTQLVGFSVNGVIILAFLWVLKAFLEVVCTIGSVVFVSVLLIRGIWTGILYLQESRYRQINELDNEHHDAWTGTQPVT